MTEWWRPTFQTTVDAFAQGDLAAGLDACEKLRSLDVLPEWTELRMRRNAVFYTPSLDQLVPTVETIPVEFPVPTGWTRFNPSIAADPAGDAFRMTVRSSNFTLDWRHVYTVNDDSGIIQTRNYLAELSPDLRIRQVQSIDDAAVRPQEPRFPVLGFEDCRPFWFRGSWWATAAVRDRNPRGKSQVVLLRLDGAAFVEEELLSTNVERHEKNWMPTLGGEECQLRLIYSSYPTVILEYDEASASVVPLRVQPATPIARYFHGGTHALPLDGGHVCLVHEFVYFDDGNKSYSHRWVWFDADWRLARVSVPFWFQERGVEFAAGLARRGDELIVSYGRWDREAFLAVVPVAEARSLLAPVRDPEEIEQDMRSVMPTPGAVVTPAAEPATDGGNASDADAARESLPAAKGTPSIVSTTLTGNSCEVIADALRSVVDWVDWVLVIDTGVTDATLEIAREIAGDRLVVRTFPWQEDFAAARNFALAAAAELGADWAVTLDSDERLHPGDVDVRAALAETTAMSLRVVKSSAGYAKERFFRLPARGHWEGATHEAFIRESSTTETLEGVAFSELAKTAEQYRRKAERDVAILSRYTAEHPDDPRWYYYLGDSLAGLDRHEEAVAAFRICAGLNGWDEEGAWAMYRAGQSLLKLDRPEDAVAAYAAGMARHAGLAELPWMAAYASWQAGKAEQAVFWARQSIVIGHFAGTGAAVKRIGFRHPPGLWEGPYDVLRFALKKLGDDSGAEEAEHLYHEAKAAREAREHAGSGES